MIKAFMILDSAKFAAVVESAKVRATGDASWLRAIDRAATGLVAGEILVSLLSHGAIVSTPNGSYYANGRCQCAPARHKHSACRHRAAARLLVLYEGAAQRVEIVSAQPEAAATSAA
jgi:hypothetical protein